MFTDPARSANGSSSSQSPAASSLCGIVTFAPGEAERREAAHGRL